MAEGKRPRQRRVTQPENKVKAPNKAALTKRNSEQTVVQGIPIGANGLPMIEVISQASETVPVAQFANVVIGPVATRRWVQDPEDEDKLGDILDKYQATVEDVVSDDREIVYESVRHWNEVQAKQEADAKKKDSASKPSAKKRR